MQPDHPPRDDDATPTQDEGASRVATLVSRLEHCLTTGAPADALLLSGLLAELHGLQREADSVRLRYETLFNAVPDPVSILDAEGRILALNRAGLKAYRRPREEIVGKLVHVINPDLPPNHMGPVLEALARDQTYVVEVSNMRGDGTRFPVEVHSASFHDGPHHHIIAVARDLSLRQEAELNYHALLSAIDKGVLFQGFDGRPLSANPAAYRILGIDDSLDIAASLRFDDWLVIDHRGYPISFRDLPPLRSLATGEIVESTLLGLYHHRRKQLTWISATSVPQFHPGASKPHQVISLFSDVTELKRDSSLFLRAQALARIGGWEWDGGRRRLYLTDEALRIIGRRDDPPMTLDDVMEQIAEAHRQPVEDAIESVIRDGGGFDLEVQVVRPDGERHWARLIGQSEGRAPMSTRLTGTLQDITQRRQIEEALRSQARTDPLTGLFNRDGILGELERRLGDDATGTTVIYVDLDRFKLVNDLLGHAAGDHLLVNAARRLERCVGDTGLLARFGGDEFLVVTDQRAGAGMAELLAERITRAFGDSFRYAGEEFTITTSVGLARHPEHGRTVQQLVNNADAAMYAAKRKGRNTWQVFNPELAQQQHDRVQIEAQLRRALDNGEFRLVFQPLVSLADGRVRTAEALIRWHNPTLGEISPDHFISHAETTGDIVRIGAWVIEAACRQMAAWRDAGLPLERVAVNVSYRQFLTEDLVQTIAHALREHGLPGSALELEFTERVLIEDAPDTLNTFEALRALGVVLTIDDFGEGYSALNYLRRLPIHGLKLAHSFLQGVPANPSDVAICQAVAGMARGLGLDVVAEGVESPAQRDFLLGLGIGTGQGFLFSPGLEPDSFAAYLRQAGLPVPEVTHD
ncbi:sensor domain-containing protein [Arenimonas sp.]|uniref:sensor domain-containing protein n=1 Tax=Arenimonas sp. TaxID=1872635 RepID=UPI002E3526BE|nr:EAL domain-containing protein [Arenimonas sp.]HEX4854643.1 EAL domain-containing protein [Arenimonas sp.]